MLVASLRPLLNVHTSTGRNLRSLKETPPSETERDEAPASPNTTKQTPPRRGARRDPHQSTVMRMLPRFYVESFTTPLRRQRDMAARAQLQGTPHHPVVVVDVVEDRAVLLALNRLFFPILFPVGVACPFSGLSIAFRPLLFERYTPCFRNASRRYHTTHSVDTTSNEIYAIAIMRRFYIRAIFNQ